MDSPSRKNPQLVPSDHCYSILQDHGVADGGWGPAAVMLPGFLAPTPIVYTSTDEVTLAALDEVARELARAVGKETRLVRYERRVDVATYNPKGGSVESSGNA